MYLIHTDGSCEPNPGIGGWGFTLLECATGVRRDKCGGNVSTTNNRMEMQAILEAMRAVPDGEQALIMSDSQYCINGLTIWRPGWKAKGWNKKGSPMINRDLWLELEAEMSRIKPRFEWVRGHNGDEWNERADALANDGRLIALGGA
ncbi:MAG: ribonuclease H [bacterium]|jgi:ribonuclease HI